jgi:hypothetical protein
MKLPGVKQADRIEMLQSSDPTVLEEMNLNKEFYGRIQ